MTLTDNEIDALQKLADATKLCEIFYAVGPDEVLDPENHLKPWKTVAKAVATLESGLAYDIVEHEGLTIQEAETCERCFARARAELHENPSVIRYHE